MIEILPQLMQALIYKWS